MANDSSFRSGLACALLLRAVLLCIFCIAPSGLQAAVPDSGALRVTVEALAALGDRASGTAGARAASSYVHDRLAAAGPEKLLSLEFPVAVLEHEGSAIRVGTREIPVTPLLYNAITPENLPDAGISGPLIYVGKGELADFNGHGVDGAIVLMEFDSGRNWLNAASLGASALIYIDRGASPRERFEDKIELSPIQFPCFFMEEAEVLELVGGNLAGATLPEAHLTSRLHWVNKAARNHYALFPGTDPERSSELLVVEAFYDASFYLPGRAPGADEALGVASLLDLAAYLQANPPTRSFLLIASDAHSRAQAGMRETVWTVNVRSKELRTMARELKETAKTHARYIESLQRLMDGAATTADDGAIQQGLQQSLKLEIDRLSSRLMRLRMQESSTADDLEIKELAARRLQLRQLGWRTGFTDLGEQERTALRPVAARAVTLHEKVLVESERKERLLKQTRQVRSLLIEYEPKAWVSLHLSSHGGGLGAFHRGHLYPLRPSVNRTGAYRAIHDVLDRAAAGAPVQAPVFISTLRPNRIHPWEDLLPDKPHLAGEVSSLASLPGLTLATTGDLRSSWGTPFDTPDRIDWTYAGNQNLLVRQLILALDQAGDLPLGYLRNGFGTVGGRAGLLLHGELFAEQPAPETVLLAFQGKVRYHLIADQRGRFLLKGVAIKQLVQDKIILEGYRFSREDGRVLWAIDKRQTGKDRYRVKMNRNDMETELVMFNCRQTTIFNLLEPRSLRYMTKLNLLDGRREAPPNRYWYSRIDTRSSIIASIYLEPESRLKLTLSDTVLKRKMILTNASAESPNGTGYRVDDHPLLPRTNYLSARDIWTLLTPRIENLEEHGIHNDRIAGLREEGLTALDRAEKALADLRYDQFNEQASQAWALASRVYDHVEKTQKDVLFGVLFYIALFVPFAFCLERLLFGFVSIYKRIIAFTVILVLLILVIASVHPAFALAYSPTVVIIAFFIIGLSLLVTLIIFFRFEEEMVQLQRRSSLKRPLEISAWKAFAAAFFLGVSNLRRRRLRTGLTCLTLVILTFTIMSFTTVKSMRRQNRLDYSDRAGYQGILIKDIAWKSLPQESLPIFRSLFQGKAQVAPRVWLDAGDQTRAARFQFSFQGRPFVIQGLTGLAPEEPQVTGLEKILLRGRWFRPDEPESVLLPSGLAAQMDIDPDRPGQDSIDLWGRRMKIVGIYSEKLLQQYTDLDGEIMTPIVFPSETMVEMSEVELEAMSSGEDVQTFQGRYRHIEPEQVLILPAATLLEMGGSLKAVALQPPGQVGIDDLQLLSDRFNLTLFSGEPDGVFVYTASDTMNYSGMPNIIVPLLISVLIVLNTMISSVYERKREIAVYTSVGLAPTHVSFLFVAEAMAFAVLSVVLGYLVAQSSAELLAGTRIWSGITVNYSSMAGVAAMFLVMAVVLLSVIYPSRVAAQIAIPDVNRSWKLPEAEGDTMSVTLPFLMRYHEHPSICGFLHEYLRAHQDVSHGIFSTGPIEVSEGSGPTHIGIQLPMADNCLHLRAKVWLAPFDFGIMQWVDLRFCKAREGEDFLEINVSLTRRAGESTVWRRVNGSFLHALRKQLLIWRSLDEAGHVQYRELLPEVTEPLEEQG